MSGLMGMLGLCMRANRLVSGQQAVENAIKAKEAQLVIIDEGASQNTKKAVMDACRFYGVRAKQIKRQSLGLAIGKPGRMLAAVTDSPFAERICQLLDAGD